ncbi:MAG: ATP-dependent Clp protease ATP-binding subunit [Eubacteriales bacterium]|nr:ATP-dependent Clp protease ATP-binding subunit [Eubacteriales bacterium]MDY5439684.1 ATP-dependent Clp protease ATP-binding subunit [Eubacteriales bacterium]
MNNYTKTVKVALEIAEKVAITTSNQIGTEHILFGLLCTSDSVACKVLTSHGISKEIVQNYINPKGGITFNIGKSYYTPRAKNVKQVASLIASELHQEYVGTEHFLLAILDDNECVAYRILEAYDVDVNAIKRDFLFDIRNNVSSQKDEFEVLDRETPMPNVKTYEFNEGRVAGSGYDSEELGELEKMGVDLTKKALRGILDPVIGRDDEIERIIQVLCRRTKNNPVLVGEPGVGKSAIADGLAEKIVSGDVPELLKGKRVFSLDMASIVAGTKYRGEFEEKFKNVLNAVRASGNVILFIDEIHTIVSAGASEGSLDAANILKPMLARGEIQTIGATTFDEYRKYIEKDPALERRFQPVTVEPPNVENTIRILKGLRDKYEAHHKVIITDEAIVTAAEMADRYITDRFMPDKAIDLIDEAASKKRISAFIAPDNLKKIEDSLKLLQIELDEAKHNEKYDEAIKLKIQRDELLEIRSQVMNDWKNKRTMERPQIASEDVADIVSNWTNIPVTKLTEDESKKLMDLENILKNRVVGQNEAVISVAKAIKRARAGLKDPNRPIGSFIFLGPTGVGKTELSKALAEAMFGDENLLIRVDMSEYMDKISVSKMIGSAPGYAGYDEGGQLTEKVRRHPYSVVLFDEIEKAHPDVFNILLQVLDDGRITDSHGRTVSFKNTIIIMTSNLGASECQGVGFGSRDLDKEYEIMKERQIDALKREMRPEFINRIDEIIVFRKLGEKQMQNICDIMLSNLRNRLKVKNIDFLLTDEAKTYIVKQGTDVDYGARPLRRTIQKLIEDRISEEILLGKVSSGDTIKIDFQNGDLSFLKI